MWDLLPEFSAEMELDTPRVVIANLEQIASPRIIHTLLNDLRQTPGIALANPFLIYREHEGCQSFTNDIIVGLKKTDDEALLRLYTDRLRLKINREDSYTPGIYYLSTTSNSPGDALGIANTLAESGDFLFAEPDFLLLQPSFTNDPLYEYQWTINNEGQITGSTPGADMKVDQAWGINTGNSNIWIAVLDNGVQLNHPDLSANLVGGYDATGQGSGGAPTYSQDAHGTACAGLVAARANNNIGVAGIAYNCRVMPIRISYNNTPDGWTTMTSWLANGINWAWQNGADVLSNSWGGGSSSSLVNGAIDNAVSNGRQGKGCPVLFAAGNSNTSVSYPAYYAACIAVGATSPCDERKSPSSCDGVTNWGSNFGSGLDVSAPGVYIMTTDLTGTAGYNTSNTNFPYNSDYDAYYGGTSAACPNAAAVMGLILSVNSNLTQAQARAVLESTCDKVGGYSYSSNAGNPNGSWTSQLGHGRVNAFAALQAASGGGGGGGGACSGTTNLTACSGSFSDGSGSSEYGAGLDCSWRISPSGATSVTLTFTSFSTEEDYDFVRVYNGTSASAPLIGEYSGSTLPSAVTANSGNMYVVFTTDGSVGDAGWSASYTCSTGGGGGGGLTMATAIAINPSPVVMNQAATANFNITNNTGSAFSGEISIDLYNADGEYLNEIESKQNLSLCSGCSFSSNLTYNFTLGNAAGNYVIAVWYRANGGEWAQVEDGSYNNVISIQIVNQPAQTLSATPSTINAGAASGSAAVSVSSNCNNWTVSGAPSWITLSASSGSGNGSFNVNYGANTATSARSATLTISGCSLTFQVTVQQAGATATLSATPSTINAGAASGSAAVSVSSNCNNWTVSGAPSWITLSASSGSGNGSFNVNYSANTATSARSATLTISGCSLTFQVTVQQAGATATLSATPSTINAGAASGSAAVSVSSNCNNWTVSGAPSWITLSASSGSGNSSFDVNYSANTATSARSATLTISGCSLTFQVTVQQAGAQLSSPWIASPTGINHTIIIPSTLESSIDGTPLESGDVIGFFFERNSQLYCSNFAVWTGQNTSCAVYGNDAATGQPANGFIPGEVFKVKVYRAANQEILSGIAAYAPVGTNGIVSHTNAYANDGISMLTSLTGSGGDTLDIILMPGWNTISSYVIPDEPDLVSVLAPVASQVILLKDEDGQSVIPALGINNVGDWNETEGYQVKVESLSTLTIRGIKADPSVTPIPIREGWQIISYLRDEPGDASAQLSSIFNQIEIVKNNAGQTYIPAFGINNIGQLLPTQGYKLKSTGLATLLYPPNFAPTEEEWHRSSVIIEPLGTRRYVLDSTLNTGNNSTMVFPAPVIETMLNAGDELGIFTPSGILCGAAVYMGQNLAITVWGDDATTASVVEGMLPGERYTIKAWQSAAQVETSFEASFSEGDDFYQVDDLEIISSLEIVNGFNEIEADNLQLLKVYPNPSERQFSVVLPTDARELEIYDAIGRGVFRTTIERGASIITLDALAFPKGALWVKVIDGNQKCWRAVVLIL